MANKKKGGRQSYYCPPQECKEFGKVLRAYRKRLGLSLAQVGEMLGYKESSVEGLEAGKGFSSSLCEAVPRVYRLTEKDEKRWFELRAMMMKRNLRCFCLEETELPSDYEKGSLGERIKNFAHLLVIKRHEMGLSRKDFSKVKGFSANFVRYIEIGLRFSATEAKKVPKAYGLSLEETAAFNFLREETKGCVTKQWNGRNCKGVIYIYTDGSEYEFPVYITDSIQQLAELTGTTQPYISQALSDHYRFGYNTRFRTTLEPVSESDEVEEQRIKDYLEKRYGVCLP